MVAAELIEFLQVLPALDHTPGRALWSSYDAEGDVLYINFRQPASATDSEITDDDVIVRYDDDEIIGYTILHARSRFDALRHQAS